MHGGGLTCSFNDYQLSEFIQMKQRCQGKLPMKKAVVEVGPQADGSWSLGPSLHFDNNGQLLDTSMFGLGTCMMALESHLAIQPAQYMYL